MVEPMIGTIAQIKISMAERTYINPICIRFAIMPIRLMMITIALFTLLNKVSSRIVVPKLALALDFAWSMIQVLSESVIVFAKPAKGMKRNDTAIIFPIPITSSWAFSAPLRARASWIPAPIRQPKATRATTGTSVVCIQ